MLNNISKLCLVVLVGLSSNAWGDSQPQWRAEKTCTACHNPNAEGGQPNFMKHLHHKVDDSYQHITLDNAYINMFNTANVGNQSPAVLGQERQNILDLLKKYETQNFNHSLTADFSIKAKEAMKSIGHKASSATAYKYHIIIKNKK